MLVATPGQTAPYMLTTNASGVSRGGSGGGGGSSGTGTSAAAAAVTLTKKSYITNNMMNKTSTGITTSNYYPIITARTAATTSTLPANTSSNINNITKFTISALQQQKHALARDIATNRDPQTINTTTTTRIKMPTSSSSGNSSGTSNANTSDNGTFSRSLTFNESSRSCGASSLVKSLTVRLNRGTETLKATVQRALGAAGAVSGITSNRSLQEYHNRNSNNSTVRTNNSSGRGWTRMTTTTATTLTNTISNTLKYSYGNSGSDGHNTGGNSLTQSVVVPNHHNNNSVNASSNKIYNSKINNNNKLLSSVSTSASVVAIPTNSNRNYNINYHSSSHHNHNLNISSSKNPSRAFLKLYTIPPTIYHRYPNECIQMSKLNHNSGSSSNNSNSSTNKSHSDGGNGNGNSNGSIIINNRNNNKNNGNNNSNRKRSISTDSLNMEMCHFKPIRSVPTTPWKSTVKSRGCVIRSPKLLKPLTRKFHVNKFNCDVKTKLKMVEEMKRHQTNKNNEIKENDVCKNFKPKLSSSTVLLSRLLAAKNHRSAFVCLIAQMEKWNWDDSDEDQPDMDMSVGKLAEGQVNVRKRRDAQQAMLIKSCANLHKMNDTAAAAVTAIAEAAVAVAAVAEAAASTSAAVEAVAGKSSRTKRKNQLMPPPPPPPASLSNQRISARKLRSMANVDNSDGEVKGPIKENTRGEEVNALLSESTTTIETFKSPVETLRRSLRTTKSSKTLLKANLRKSVTSTNTNQSRRLSTTNFNNIDVNKSIISNIIANTKENMRGKRGGRSSSKQVSQQQGSSDKETTTNEVTASSSQSTTASRKSKINAATKTIKKNKDKMKRGTKSNANLLTSKPDTTRTIGVPTIKRTKLTRRERPQGQRRRRRPQPKLNVTKSQISNIVQLAKEVKQKANAIRAVAADTAATAAATAAATSKRQNINKNNSSNNNNNNNNNIIINRKISRKRKRTLPHNNIDEEDEDEKPPITVESSSSSLTFTTNVSNKSSTLFLKRKKVSAFYPPSIKDARKKSKQRQQKTFNDNNDYDVDKMTGKRRRTVKSFNNSNNASDGNEKGSVSGSGRGSGRARGRGNDNNYKYLINKERNSPPLTRARMKNLNNDNLVIHVNTELLKQHISGKL